MVAIQRVPAPLGGGIELHIVAYQGCESPGGDEFVRGTTATVLINFSEETESREIFGVLNQAFPSSLYSQHVFDGSTSAKELGKFLRRDQFAVVDAVIYAGTSKVPPELLQSIVNEVRSLAPGIVVMVGDDCLQWGAIDGITGFIKGAGTTNGATVMAIFALVAALQAPDTLTCLDHEHVAAALGAAAQPSVLVEAVWLREDRRLVYVRAEDSDLVGRAEVVSCHLLAINLRVAESRDMINCLVAAAAPDCTVHYQAPLNAYIAPFFQPSVALMTMLCKLRAEDERPD